MKHPRFYTALPRVGRVRSNSASRALYTSNTLPISFFDGPAPPNRNGPLLTTHRLSIEGKGEVEAPPNSNAHQTHAPLALAAPHAPAAPPSAQQLALFKPYSPGPAFPHPPAPTAATSRAARRRGPRYTLDVGAYGIPKRCHRPHQRGLHTQTEAPLAVQVGEDAYFVRENAMGVADGVGGWARVKHPGTPPASPSASALFARRLMHFCADEVDRAASSSAAQPPPDEGAFDGDLDVDLDAALAAELDELADGLDVLRILERAYERTLEAHVVPVPPPLPVASRSATPTPAPARTTTPTPTPTPPLWSALLSTPPEAAPRTIPLLAGSSTALVAVLDYVPVSNKVKGTGSVASTMPMPIPIPTNTDAQTELQMQPVLKIAHLGDCMGMLVRGGEVAWRSEEMWWRWNTPVHARTAPHAEVTPASAAHLFTLPVQAGDILILASDGLSDNLWDEDVLEEVRRVGGVFRGCEARKEGTEGMGKEEHATEEMGGGGGLLRRRTLAGMLSEALCSRARRVATRRAGGRSCKGASSASAGAAMNAGVGAASSASEKEKAQRREGKEVRAEGKEGKEGVEAAEAEAEAEAKHSDGISGTLPILPRQWKNTESALAGNLLQNRRLFMTRSRRLCVNNVHNWHGRVD
ncbi:hypothetical protein DFH09DRAFT_983133 [Mycena vulgaris]|nr:hypothetical protein DFH09DRAFT_983133 [Mycena vulgaris]